MERPLEFVTSYSAVTRSIAVIDGLTSTRYACRQDRLLWIHEVGGIVVVDHWLGPVPAEPGEIEEIAPPIQKYVEGAP